MIYKLEFVKIAPEHGVAGVGFAGNIFIVMGALSHLKNPEDMMYVDMETNECICTEKDIILHDTMNSWEYYFDQIKIKGDDAFIHMDIFQGRGDLTYHDRDVYLNPDNFIRLRDKFYKNFQIKDYIKIIVNEFYDNNIRGKNTLGIQVRLTDYTHGVHNFPGVEKYVDRIKEILIDNPEIEQIFVATDDSKVIPVLEKNFNIPIIFWEGMFRADDKNLHLISDDRLYGDRELHRYKLGVECMKEIFTLTKCDHLLMAWTSSISIVSSILSEKIKKVYKI
jgi:hypothetical protein